MAFVGDPHNASADRHGFGCRVEGLDFSGMVQARDAKVLDARGVPSHITGALRGKLVRVL